jgi:hypothetical protein
MRPLRPTSSLGTPWNLLDLQRRAFHGCVLERQRDPSLFVLILDHNRLGL